MAPKAELSAEDAELKANLLLMVSSASDPDAGVQRLALEGLRKEIRSATSSMTSVPKPIKFLRPAYDTLKATYEACGEGEEKRLLADIISLLAMTLTSDPKSMPESLRFRLLGSSEEIGSFGHEARLSAAELSALAERPAARAHAPPTRSTCATWRARSRTSGRGGRRLTARPSSLLASRLSRAPQATPPR